MCCEEAFPGLGVQGVEDLILVGALFLLNGGSRREGKKKENRKQERKKKKNIDVEKEDFPRPGLALLAVQCVAAVRCN
jgi:hypothetical protein